MSGSAPEVRRVSGKKKLLFGLIITILIYIPADIVHRVMANRRYEYLLGKLGDCYLEHETLGYIFKPGPGDYFAQTQGAEIDYRYHINRHGMRGPEIADEKEKGTVRILCLGGSTTFSTGCARDETTYPAQLQTALERRIAGGKLRAERVEVLNAGVPGYRSAESILQFERYRHLDADIVIVYHGINDITWGNDTDFYRDPLNHPRPEERLQRARRRASSSLIVAAWHRLMNPRREKLDGAGSRNYPTARTAFEGNLETLADNIRASGAVPVFATFETRLRDGLDAKTRKVIEEDPSFSISFERFDEMLEALRSYNDSVRRVAGRQDVACIDLTGKVPADAANWSDFCHVTDEGAPYMAKALAGPLVEVITKLLDRSVSGSGQ